MLKFADLSVDFKSYENSLDSYMKLFPGSYTPLLIMYLAHEGLLKLVYEFEENDPRIFVSVDGNSLHVFFGDGIMQELIPDPNVWEHENKTLEETLNLMNRAILKDRDAYVMQPLVHLWPSILAGKSLALIADFSKDEPIADLVKIILASDPSFDNPAALLYFSMMLMLKYEPLPTKDDDVEKKTPEEIEKEKRLDLELWIEDFENTLEKILSYAGNKDCFQPAELTRVILTQRNGGSIYNPFAGLASYAIQLHNNLGLFNEYEESAGIGDYYYGEEINDLTWAIGKLRLMACHSDSKNYNLADSADWRGGIANNVISTPPFGVQIENEKGKKEYADHFVIRRGLDTIDDNGFLACVVPMSFMYRRDTADLRKRIIDEGLLESIVYLPRGIFSSTSIRTAILFIRKISHQYVSLINATDAIFSRNGRLNILDEEQVANLLCHATSSDSYIYDSRGIMEDVLPESKFRKLKIYVDNVAIEKAGYDLTPGRFFIAKMSSTDGFKLTALKHFVEGYPEGAGKTGRGKVIQPSMLSTDEFTPLIPEAVLEDEYKHEYRMVDQSAVLFTPFSSPRPTLLINPGREMLYFKPDLIKAVFLKERAIDPEYLIMELYKPYVQEQIRLLAKGDVMQRLTLEDILSIHINVPSIRTQAIKVEKNLVDEKKALYYSKLNAELAALKDKQHEDYVKMLRQRKHRIQQIMNEFAPSFTLLNKCRKDHDGVLHNNDVVASRTGETVEDYFEKLDTIVAKVEYLVTNLVDKDAWGKIENVNIDDFIDKISSQHLLEKFDIQPVHNRDFEIEEEGEYDLNDPRLIIINRDDLATLFDNIIANASKWGFVDDVRNDYRIRIEVADSVINDQRAVRISVSNNGTPIHPSVDRSRFFEWGYGSGSGIGTSQMKDIVEHYGGTINLKEDPDDVAGFCTTYEIVLPLKTDE